MSVSNTKTKMMENPPITDIDELFEINKRNGKGLNQGNNQPNVNETVKGADKPKRVYVKKYPSSNE